MEEVDSRINRRAVAVGHHAHVVAVDRTVSDGNPICLVDSHFGPIVRLVVRPDQLESSERAAVGPAVELKDCPGLLSHTAEIETLAREFHSSAVGAARNVRFFCTTKTATRS